MTCELCKRDVELTEHHLIPREMHNKKWCQRKFSLEERKNNKASICHDCHGAIHKFLTNKELAQTYNTVDRLIEEPKVANFVRWVSKDIKRKFKY